MNLFHTYVSRSARQYADEVLASGNLSEGRMVKAFEESLARELGLCNPVCVNSGTSALHLALMLAEVKPGDEVILPPQTFVATGMAVLYCGATPVFADVCKETGCISWESAESKITEKTVAIMAVDWAGLCCDYRPLSCVAADYDLPIIRDAAQALGTKLSDDLWQEPLLTCYSLQATKHLTTGGDGGVLCCEKECDADTAKRLRWFGIDREQQAGDLGERDFALMSPGFKYNMTDLDAAVGLGNLETFKDRLMHRQANGDFYRRELANVSGLTLPRLPHNRSHAYYVFPALVERRDDFARMMRGKGIPVSVVCSRIDHNPVFGGQRDDLPGMDYFDKMQINLPCHEAMSDNDLREVVKSVREGW